ncbi:hypothetical protein EMCRGX_G002938 [Ephydatia muelleri]
MQKLQVQLWSALFQKSEERRGDKEGWKICVRTKDEKRRILESCHAGIEGGIDLISPLPTTSKGNKYVVTLVDYFSKWPEGAPLKDKTAASVALFLFETFCSLIKVVNSSQDDWDEHLSAVLFAYQTSVQKATKLTPFEIMYCRKPKLPIDMEYAMSSTENGDGARNDESDGDVHTGDGDGALNDELDGDVYTGDGDGALNDESDGDVHTGDGDGAPNDESDGDVHSGDGNCEIQKSKNTSLEGPSSTYEWNPDEIVHQATKMVQIKKMITETTMSNIEKAQQKVMTENTAMNKRISSRRVGTSSK